MYKVKVICILKEYSLLKQRKHYSNLIMYILVSNFSLYNIIGVMSILSSFDNVFN